MIRIIEPGIPTSYVARCEECNCRFTFDNSDLSRERYDRMFGRVEALSIDCPYCGAEVTQWEIYTEDDE